MLLGVEVEPLMLVVGGSFIAALLAFQILQGLRVIRLKGRLHLQVHKAVAFVLAAAAAFHALAGLAFLGVIG
jgi:predicted Co/Zn/Cd cation transporter (cation efflux family)